MVSGLGWDVWLGQAFGEVEHGVGLSEVEVGGPGKGLVRWMFWARFGKCGALVKVTGQVKGWVGQVEPSQAKRVGERRFGDGQVSGTENEQLVAFGTQLVGLQGEFAGQVGYW